MTACYCDFEQPSVLHATVVKAARATHRCRECGRQILPGEPYTRAWGVWDRVPYTHKCCSDCGQLEAHMEDLIPCFCWAYGELHDATINYLESCRGELPPGSHFRALRLIAKTRLLRKQQSGRAVR